MEFTFLRGDKPDSVVLAMQKARSIIPLPVLDCPLMPFKAREAMQLLPDLLQPLNLHPYDQRTARGDLIRAVFKSGITDNVERVLLHLRVNTDENLRAIADTCAASIDQVCIEGPEESVTVGDPIIHAVDETRYIVTPHVFFQPNLALLPQLLDIACTLAGEGRVVWDLFSGAGTLGVRLAQRGWDVHAVDMSLLGLADNAKLNDVRVNAVEMNLEHPAVNLSSLPFPDVVFVDPPRDGCPRPLRRWLKNALVPRIVYVSCNPRTLHRDAMYLAEAGYVLQQVVPLDFHPHNSHIECVALLTQ